MNDTLDKLIECCDSNCTNSNTPFTWAAAYAGLVELKARRAADLSEEERSALGGIIVRNYERLRQMGLAPFLNKLFGTDLS